MIKQHIQAFMRQKIKRFMIVSTLPLLLLAPVQIASAHTVIQPPEIKEGQRAELTLVTTHGCGEAPLIGVSVVFPDGVDSTIVANGSAHNGPLNDFIENWGNNFQLYQDYSIFSEQDTKKNSLGNVVGFWSGGGRTISSHLYGRISFVGSPVIFKSDSCAKTVRFTVASADICKITSLSEMLEENTVSFWVPAVGSKYDGTPGGHAYDFPINLTFKRDLEANPLPESCGAGLQVTVRPSAAQLDRDMPVIFNGTQVWPKP